MSGVDIEWFDLLECPDCRSGILAPACGEDPVCRGCGRSFGSTPGILQMLPLGKDGSFEDSRLQREYYDTRAADSIDLKRRRFGPLHYNKARGIIREARLLDGAGRRLRICEIGAGTAIHASWLLEKVEASVFFGIDISVRALENGRRRWEARPEFVPLQGSAYSLPLTNGAVDLAYFSGTLHHCMHPAEAIAEAGRILRPGGRLVISEPVWYFPSNLYLNLTIPEESGQRLLRRGAVERWCEEAGLRAGRFEHFNYVPRPRRIDAPVRAVERILSIVPLFGRLSSMFRYTAEKNPD